jgi:glycosyltransferase involved in cell wall biosynthesis
MVHNVMTMPFDLPLTEALAELAKSLRGTRWIAWVHDIAAVNPDLQPAPEILKRAAEGFEYIAVSALRARQFAETTGVLPWVIPNGINPAEILGLAPVIAEFAERHGLFDGRPVLLHPTRLLRRKNVELGFAVIDALRAGGVVLLLTGAEDPHNPASREYAAWLRAECARLNVADRVIYTADELPSDDRTIAGLYQLADALFLPSRQEGFGLPVLEAALHRMPAFVSDIEPINKLAQENVARFSLEETPHAIARLIQETLASEPASQARKRALGYRWDRIYEDFLSPLLTARE